MKKLILFGLMSAFSLSASARDLLHVQLNPGFTPDPKTLTVTVDEVSGIVTSVIAAFNNGKTPITTSTVIARLSKTGLKNLQTKIATIDTSSQLKDQQPGQPNCTDAPSFEITVAKGSADVSVFKRASCHSFQIEDGEADNLIAIANGLFTLR